MKFCLYEWTAPKYRHGDGPKRPTGFSQQVCTKEKGHKDDHMSDKYVTCANIKTRSTR